MVCYFLEVRKFNKTSVSLGSVLPTGERLLVIISVDAVGLARKQGVDPSKLEALRSHLAQGAQQAKAGDFVDAFSMDALISDLENEA